MNSTRCYHVPDQFLVVQRQLGFPGFDIDLAFEYRKSHNSFNILLAFGNTRSTKSRVVVVFTLPVMFGGLHGSLLIHLTACLVTHSPTNPSIHLYNQPSDFSANSTPHKSSQSTNHLKLILSYLHLVTHSILVQQPIQYIVTQTQSDLVNSHSGLNQNPTHTPHMKTRTQSTPQQLLCIPP